MSNAPLRVIGPVPYMPVGYAPVAMAEILGYAREDGVEVRVGGFRSPDQTIEAVADGRADIGLVNTVFALLKREAGRPVRAFYSFTRKTNRTFGVPRSSAIARISDLKGAVIGLHFPDLLDLARAALYDEGVDPERDVTFVPLPGDPLNGPLMAEPMQRGDVHAVWALDWLYGIFAGEGLPLRRVPMRTLDRLTPSACLYASEECLALRSDDLAVLGRAVARGTVFCQTNPEAAVRLMWRHVPETRPAPGTTETAGLARDVGTLAVRLENLRIDDQAVPRWGAITEGEMQSWQEFLTRTGIIRGARAPADYFTDVLVDRFNDFDPAPVMAQARAFSRPA